MTGKYFHFLQQAVCMETDDNGQPFLFLNYVHDFSHIKKQRTGNLVITWPGTIKWWNVNVENNRLEPMKPLSRQEKIILSCLAEGKSSKEIANELFISPFTVDTQKKPIKKNKLYRYHRHGYLHKISRVDLIHVSNCFALLAKTEVATLQFLFPADKQPSETVHP